MNEQLALLPEYLTAHLQLALLALLLSTAVSVPLGVAATRIAWLEQAAAPSPRAALDYVLDGDRLLGNVSLSAATRAFWPDVLTSEYHGYSDGYTLVNGAFGVKWRGGTVTTLVKVTNLLNRSIQQHVFGDILRRTVVGEVRFDLP